MSSSAAIGRLFGAASLSLFGLAAYWTYHSRASARTQLVPASSALPPLSATAPGARGLHASPGFPVVLPPNTSGAAAAAFTADALQQCAEAATHGLPSSAEVRCYGGYLASLNYERRIPNWVMEVVDYSRLHGARRGGSSGGDDSDGDDGGGAEAEVSRTRSAFYADDTVPPAFRVGPDGYTSRGMSRGHLAAAQLHKASQAEMNATFNMNANIVPQDMTLNAVDWLRLEGLTRKLSKEVSTGAVQQQRGRGRKRGESAPTSPTTSGHSNAEGGEGGGGRLFVVTGPAFVPRQVRVERRPDGTEVHVPLSSAGTDLIASAPRKPPASGGPVKTVLTYELTGDAARGALVAVPTHLFKVFVAEEDGGRTHSAAAFLMPNGPITEQQPLTAYQVPVDRLQQITGLQFFPGVDAARLPDLCKRHKCDARPSALSLRYRQVAQLRAADTVPKLRQTYAAMQVAASGAKLDEAVVREFEKRTEELVAESVGPVDRLERP